MDVQGKLFITVIQAQNLNITQDKKTAAEEIVGALFDPFSSPILQSIEKIQNFSKSNVFTPIGGIIDTIATVGKSETTTPITPTNETIVGENEEISTTGIVCSITTEEQLFKTTVSSNVVEPKWTNQSHSFNISHPCAQIKFEVSLNNGEKESFLIGGSIINLLDEPHLWEQKPFSKWLNLTKKHKDVNSSKNNNGNGMISENSIIGNEYDQFSDEDEIVGRIEVQFQYKYRRVWDPIYCGKILLLEGDHQGALVQFKEAIGIYPSDPFIYSLMVDCYLALKQFKSAIENNVLFIKYDKGFDGLLKMATVLMEANQLEKVQVLIDRASKIAPNNPRVKYCQLQFNHTVEVDKVNKAIEQGYDEFSKDDFASAAASFGRALEYNANSVILYELRALSHLAARNTVMATADVNKILEIDHNWTKTNPIQSGHLLKDGQINVMSKKRWFSIKSFFLFYYVEQNDLTPQGMVSLVDFGCAPKPGQKVKFQLQTKDRTFNFKVVDDPKAFDKWVISFGKIAKSKVSLPPIDESKRSIVWKNVYNKKEKTTFMLPDVIMLPEQIFVESGRFAFSIGDKIKSKLTSISLAGAPVTGFLYKMGQLNKEWKKRFFFIQGNYLYYAALKESDFEKGPVESVTPTGSMPLERCHIDQSPHATNKTNSFEVISAFRRNILLASDKPEDKDKWVKAIAIASGMQVVEKEESNDEKKNLPSSSVLLQNRSRKVKSLRAPPVVVVQQQKQKSQDDDDNNNQYDDDNNNNQDDNDDGENNNNNNNQDNQNVNSNDFNDSNSNNNNNNNGEIRDYSDQLEQMTVPTRPKRERQVKKITSNDVSSSENRYFSKFNLPSNANTPAPTIINSKSKYTSVSVDVTPDQPQDDQPESLANILGDDIVTPSQPPQSSSSSSKKSYSINDDHHSEIENDERKGLISGKKKNINDDGDDNDDKKRCCKCTIQ